MFKYTFNSFANGKQGAPIERYELPMILDGKSSHPLVFTFNTKDASFFLSFNFICACQTMNF